jgi:SAM-dependent methyltransferase
MDPKNKNYYYDDPYLYDLEYEVRREDIAFYLEKCRYYEKKKPGLNILELGCGTGRGTIPLAKEGFNIVALDSDKKMLALAREKIENENKKKHPTKLKVDLVEADFRNFDLGKKFDIAIMPFNSLQHLHGVEDIKSFFDNLRKHLKDDGIFIFEVTNPDMDDLSRSPDDVVPYDAIYVSRDTKTGKLSRVDQSEDPIKNNKQKIQMLVIEDFINYDAEKQIANFTLHYSLDDEEDIAVLKISLRAFFPQELNTILHYNGFKLIKKYGAFDKSHLTTTSPSQIVICTPQDNL